MMKRYDFMKDVAPTALPANPDVKLTKADCPLPEDNADDKYWWRPLYRSVVGSLLYAQCADRPDISVAVSKLSQFLDNPGPKHWEQAVHCLAYLKGTPELGITYTRKPAEHPWSNCARSPCSVDSADPQGDPLEIPVNAVLAASRGSLSTL